MRRRMVGGGDSYLKFWVNRTPLERNLRFRTDARSASAVTPNEKSSFNTNRKSTMPFFFEWAEDDHHTVPLSSPNGGSKTQNGRFRCKNALWGKSATKFLCVKTRWQSCRAFIGLTIRAKMIGGDIPFYAKIWWMLTHPFAHRRLSIYFCP